MNVEAGSRATVGSASRSPIARRASVPASKRTASSSTLQGAMDSESGSLDDARSADHLHSSRFQSPRGMNHLSGIPRHRATIMKIRARPTLEADQV